MKRIVADAEGMADVTGYIDEFVDVHAEAVNETLTPGGQLGISGHKIKVSGGDPEAGLYFVSATDAAQRVKVGGHLAENTATNLIGVIPGLAAETWKVEIKTQFTVGRTILKEARAIESRFVVSTAAAPV